jgi:hypothetical protein
MAGVEVVALVELVATLVRQTICGLALEVQDLL